MAKKVIVQCTYQIEIEVEDDYGNIEFDIEENHCPGTGKVGAAFDRVRKECEEGDYCWACRLQGENEILSIDGVPYVRE